MCRLLSAFGGCCELPAHFGDLRTDWKNVSGFGGFCKLPTHFVIYAGIIENVSGVVGFCRVPGDLRCGGATLDLWRAEAGA